MMGLDAQVIAIGPFSEDVVPAMEYSFDRYAGIESGKIVITNVFVAPRSSSSYELALAFGVDAMDLGRHHLDPEVANLEKLVALFGDEDVVRFILLRKHAFSFYYLPNA